MLHSAGVDGTKVTNIEAEGGSMEHFEVGSLMSNKDKLLAGTGAAC